MTHPSYLLIFTRPQSIRRSLETAISILHQFEYFSHRSNEYAAYRYSYSHASDRQVCWVEHTYDILSHAYEEGEVSYQDMMDGSARRKKGYNKIEMICKRASTERIAYVWVDTCCIDKSSSAELSEAINSMFQRYKDSVICYVYLSELRPSIDFPTALNSKTGALRATKEVSWMRYLQLRVSVQHDETREFP